MQDTDLQLGGLDLRDQFRASATRLQQKFWKLYGGMSTPPDEGEAEMIEHDHTTLTCKTCRSIDDYCQEQYRKYEAKIKLLVEAGQKLVGKGYPMLDGTDQLKHWREVSMTEKGTSA